jgi:uncharacterized repeat protein (TIGR02543 family)
MMTSRLFKIFAILAVATLASGCKLEIVAVQGGDVTWSGGSCPEGSNCVIEITDPNYSNSFTVTPKPGYQFVKWQKAPGFLCGDSTNPVCTFTMPTDANLATAVIGLFVTGYMMPVYKDVGIDTDGDGVRNELDEDDDNDGLNDDLDNCKLVGPNNDGFGCPGATITDTVTVDGRVWAQVVLFTNLSTVQISAVCPVGACINGGVLNGHNMTGWTWASAVDLHALFNFYGVDPPMNIARQTVGGSYGSVWATNFFNGGWRPTENFSTVTLLRGWYLTGIAGMYDSHEYPTEDRSFTDSQAGPGGSYSYVGAWFYRSQ